MTNEYPTFKITEITVSDDAIKTRVQAKLSGDARDSEIRTITDGAEALGLEVVVKGVYLHCDSCHEQSAESFASIAEAMVNMDKIGWVTVGSDHQCPSCRGYADLTKNFKD
jgi:hypothetical protein